MNRYEPACDPPDVYDQAVMYLMEESNRSERDFRDAVKHAWDFPRLHDAGALFKFTSVTIPVCGCLTQVKAGVCPAPTATLTEEIRADPNIPDSPYAIRPHHLPFLAAWQRRLDDELGKNR